MIVFTGAGVRFGMFHTILYEIDEGFHCPLQISPKFNTAAFLSLQLMEKEIPRAYAEQVKQQLKRLNRLEESLLMLSKIDAGTLPLKQEKVDLYTVLNLAADNLNDLIVSTAV